MKKALVSRTVIVKSEKLPRKLFMVFVELKGMYRNMVEQLTLYAVKNSIKSFTKLKALKYREMCSLYPQLPSHYVYTACQNASARARSFLKLRKRELANREHPEVRSVSIWLDDHLWRMDKLTRIRIATHSGLITVDIEPHKQFWRYVNRGWSIASEARVKLDRRERRLVFYIVFRKSVEPYQPRGFIAVDVNEDNVAMLVDGEVLLVETNMKRLVLGYYYRRKRIQKRYDKLYGTRCRAKRKVLEKLGKKPAENMMLRIKDRQLRHRIYQASFRGVQRAIEEKANE